MEQSILNSTKKILGLSADYTAFDLDILTHINTAFATLNQLGVGQLEGLYIEDDQATWADFICPTNQLHMVKTYIYLKVKLLFDPPTTSFGIAAAENQLKEHEWRLNTLREEFRVEPEIPEEVEP